MGPQTSEDKGIGSEDNFRCMTIYFKKMKHCKADKTDQEHPADPESERTKTKSVRAFVFFFCGKK